MRTADECRKLAREYRSKAEVVGISSKTATILKDIANSLTGLASQYELLSAATAQEQTPKPP